MGVTASAMRVSSGVFALGRVAGFANVALEVMSFVRVEMTERALSAFGIRADIAVARIVAVIDVAIEAGMAVEPRSRPYKDASGKPVRPIEAVRSAVVRSIVKVPIGADWRDADIYRDLGTSRRE